jgi:DNA modification methylase
MHLNHIYTGDALTVLKSLPSESVNCVVTSPPYYLLRDYNVSGQIGLENSPEKYIKNLTDVFMECYRVLKTDGTMWVVIGDSYAGSGRGWGGKNDLYSRNIQPKSSFATEFSKPKKLLEYKNKDLIGIPWRLAFSLRNAGWYLRQDIIWHKPNPMPESVRDRCTKAHEYIFLLTKSARYYFNHDAMLEPANYDGRQKKRL